MNTTGFRILVKEEEASEGAVVTLSRSDTAQVVGLNLNEVNIILDSKKIKCISIYCLVFSVRQLWMTIKHTIGINSILMNVDKCSLLNGCNTRRMAIANGMCVSFCNQPKAHFGFP